MHSSFSLLVAALAGSAVAGNYGNHTISSSSSSSSLISSSSSSAYPTTSSSASHVSSSSSIKPSGSGGYGWGPSKSTGTLTSSSASYVSSSSSTIKPSGSGGYGWGPSKSTETLTTFTTTTVCPVTTTRAHASSWEIITTYTTSTLTITSCKGGCNQHPTSVASQTPVSTSSTSSTPAQQTKTIVTAYPTTITSTQTKFVPCSTPVGSVSGTTYYSTWLTPSYIPTTYVSTRTETWTSAAASKTSLPPVQSCPAVKTIIQTVTVTAGATKPSTPANNVSSSPVSSSKATSTGYSSKPSGTGYPIKPVGTGSSSGHASGTVGVRWVKPSSAPGVFW